jgi:hypothetical protein
MYTENTESAPTRSAQAPFTEIGAGKRTEGTRHGGCRTGARRAEMGVVGHVRRS